MITMTSKGLFCKAGNFYIDPMRAVDSAVITHAHSDHARRGSLQYYTAQRGVSLLKARLGKNISVRGYAYGEKFNLNNAQVSFHPAGHILGSSQVRIEIGKKVWVASGDYKRDPDPTCEPFEVVPCDVFITEATFGTPSYTWNKEVNLGKEIYDWWIQNADRGVNSVLFAYSLGKAQRILGVLEPYAQKDIYCHSAVTPLNECYREEGIKLARTQCLSQIDLSKQFSGELFLVPQSFLQTDQSKILGGQFETAFASGWMAKNNFESGYDRGFVMSDHADWNDLVRTVKETGARRVYVQHRGKGSLVRHLKSLGMEAFPAAELFSRNPDQLALF
ncbi:MAG: ligase-associated box helicase [Bacteriovoracaceae bacterium]|nr:ligase-associated box helicase [Bacteriovoracaceae bacterium]